MALTQRAFRGRNNDGSETAATWKAAENVNWTQAAGDPAGVENDFRVRFGIEASAAITAAYKLQYRVNAGAWTDAGIQGSGAAVIVDGTSKVADGQATTDQLTSSALAFVAGEIISATDATSGSIALGANQHTEIECVCIVVASDVPASATVELRMVRSDGTPLDTYTNTPSLTVTGGTAPSGVLWAWPGAARSDGARVRVRLAAPSTNVVLRYSTDPTFATFTDTPAVASGDGDVATFDLLAGLAAATKYHYRPVLDGAEDAAKEGSFRTHPAAGAASFTMVKVGDINTFANPSVLPQILTSDALFALLTGDLHYQDPPGTATLADFYGYYDSQFEQANTGEFFRKMAVAYAWDDHDFGGNNSDGTYAAKNVARNAYRDVVPHYPLAVPADGNTINYSFVVGRVRFVIADARSERSPNANTDDVNKTMLGATQKQWVKDEIAAAKAAGETVCLLLGAIPWIAPVVVGEDDWGGFSTERTELCDFIQAEGMSASVFFLGGDMHALAADDGANNKFSTDGLAPAAPVFHGTPVEQQHSQKGGPYTHGPFLDTVNDPAQYGHLTVTDTGGATISLTFSMRRWDGTTETEMGTITSTLTVPVITGTITEGAKAGDSFAGIRVQSASVAEGASAGDSFAADARAVASFSEDAKAGEAFSGASNRLAPFAEGAKAGDSFAARHTQPGSVADGARTGDSFAAAATVRTGFSEGAKAGDHIEQPPVFTDGAVAGDSFSVRQIHRSALTETAVAGDTFVARWRARVQFVEGARAGDQMEPPTPGRVAAEVVVYTGTDAVVRVLARAAGAVHAAPAVDGTVRAGGT